MNNKIPPIFFETLDLSKNEKIILEVLISTKLACNVSSIATRAKLPRMTTYDILKRFKERKIAIRIQDFECKRAVWMLNRKFNQLGVRWIKHSKM